MANSSHCLSLMLVGIWGLTGTARSWAQSEQAAGAPNASIESRSSNQLEEILVTATRRVASIEQVPISVAAVSGDTLHDLHLNDTSSLPLVFPNLQYAPSTNSSLNFYTIRGIGTQSTDLRVEGSVSLVIDGVVQSTPGQGLGQLSDVERVEVLAGPQGMLFGKNASAGVIQIITKDPKLNVTEGDVSFSDGTLNQQQLRFAINVPLISTLALRFSGFYTHQDGEVYDAVTHQELNNDNQKGLRGKLLWQPTDNFSAKLTADYSEQTNRCCAAVLVSAAPGTLFASQAAQYGIVPNATNTTSLANDLTWQTSQARGISLDLDYDFHEFTVSSITAYRNYAHRYSQDTDYGSTTQSSGGGALAQPMADSINQRSEELRLLSPKGNLIEFVGGLYYLDKRLHTFQDIYGTLNNPSFTLGLTDGLYPNTGIVNEQYNTKSRAAFGEATFNVLPHFRLLAGGRYTADSYYDLQQTSNPGPNFFWGSIGPDFAGGQVVGFAAVPAAPTTYRLNQNHDNWSYRFGAQYDIAPGLMAYASASQGYKGPVPLKQPPITPQTPYTLSKPEIPIMYELGLKSEFLDHRVIVNVAGYQTTYRDFQYSAFAVDAIPPQLVITNAGSLRTKGIEVQTQFLLATAFRVSVDFSYQDAVFKEFTGAPCTPGQTVAQGCVGNSVNLTGTQLPFAPKELLSVIVDYHRPVVGNLMAFTNANFHAQSSYTTGAVVNPPLSSGYGVFGAGVGIGSLSGTWRASLYLRNAFDRHYTEHLSEATFDSTALVQIPTASERRLFGASVDYHFGP